MKTFRDYREEVGKFIHEKKGKMDSFLWVDEKTLRTRLNTQFHNILEHILSID
jgi:hypothetical protein